MAWKATDRIAPVVAADAPALLSEPIKDKIRSFFPRYETKRAALLPALHIVQHAFGHLSHQAVREVAELLEIPPADVLGVINFYTHFSLYPRGRKIITVCRSLTCELMGGRELVDALEEQLGVGQFHTTADGRYTIVTEECLAACEFAPCMMINERMHKKVRCEDLKKLLADEGNDELAVPRSDLFDPPHHHAEDRPGPAEQAPDRVSPADQQ